nr:S-layer homology domain-containing protein [Cohnella mopanensis]
MKLNDVDITSSAKFAGGILTYTPGADLPLGAYVVTVTAKDSSVHQNVGTLTWTFNVVERFAGGNHYYGTTHNHTNISHDAAGSPEDALKAAKYYGYDWFAFSDHSHDIDACPASGCTDTVDHKGMPERTGGSDWQLTKNLADQYTKNGSFVVFPAFEMTSTTWGHSNVFGTSNFIDRKQDGGKYQTLKNYYAWVLTYDNIVAQFNHPAMSANAFDNFIPFDKNVNKLFTMLEVGNGSGKYSYANAENKFFGALDLGWHIAPTYGEDNHDATWGKTKQRTVIVSKDLTQNSLLEAMRKMHVYMTEDPNAKLDFSANGWYMGSTVDSKNLKFSIDVSDPVLENASDPKYSYIKTVSNDNISKIELLTNGGRVIDSYTPTSDITHANWTPQVNVVGGQQWFVVRVTQKDGDRIYSSPIWSPSEPVAIKVNDVSSADGAIIGGLSANLQAGVTNLGSVDVNNITASFYYDEADAAHFIGSTSIPSLSVSQSATAKVVWASPVVGEHKIVVVLSSTDKDLGVNEYKQAFTIKAPLGKTILIDASKKNENTSKDAGTYKDNLKLLTTMMRQEGFTVSENTALISDSVLSNIAVLYISHPSSAYSVDEIKAINKFVADGGSLLLAEKSNNSGSNQNMNGILSGIGSSILINNDGIFDETTYGNFWSTPLTSNYSVRAHPTPVSNNLTDFVPTIEYYSGASLAKNNGAGGKIALTDTSSVTILVRGNESTFQNTGSVNADAYSYNVHTSKAPAGPALTGVTGGTVIPMIASETIGTKGGRIIVSGMNIFNDKQMDQAFNPKGNVPIALNAINWLVHLEPKVIKIGEARKLPEGTSVVIQGKVTTAAGVFFDSAYVQDETGGIMAFNEIPEGSLNYGDTVRIYGHIKTFENNKEIEFGNFENSIVKISSGTPVEPVVVSTGDSITEAYQGQLVKVTGTVVEIPDDYSYKINDGSGEVLVSVDGYIANQSGPVPQLQIGDTLEAVGLSGKFAEGDRIRVRDTKEMKNINNRTAASVAAGIVAITAPLKDATSLTLPAVPSGYTLAIKTSSNTAVIATNGVITPPSAETTVTLVLEITRTSDGTKAVTIGIPVLVPAKTSTGDPTDTGGNNNGNNNGNDSGNTPGNEADKPGIVTITPDKVADNGSGTLIIAIPNDTIEIKLPANTSEWLSNHSFEVRSDRMVLEIPSALIKQLENRLTADEMKTRTISLKMGPISARERGELIAKGENSTQSKIKVSGDVYEFSLSVSSASGKTVQLSQLDQPITIRLKVDPSINPKLAGIFYISDSGKLEFVGGDYINGQMVAQISHFSKYAVLELTKSFRDLSSKYWAYNVIQELAVKQIINGTTASTFEPNRSITRAEFTALLVNALKLNKEGTIGFSDVSADKWYAKPISMAYQAGIVKGKSPTIFDPNGSITREEMVTMTIKAYEALKGKKLGEYSGTPFADMNSVSAWAASSVKAAAELKLIRGRTPTQFIPHGITSRAEAAQVIYNLIGNQ